MKEETLITISNGAAKRFLWLVDSLLNDNAKYHVMESKELNILRSMRTILSAYVC